MVAGQTFEAGQMMVFRPGDRIAVYRRRTWRAAPHARRRDPGKRDFWWNFVASSQERIEAAKAEWRKADWGHGRFDLPPDDRDEFIPAPET